MSEKDNSRVPYKALAPLMEEHEQALQVCFRIREGLNRKIEKERIRNYINWFQTKYLEPHFEVEEQHIFPLLGNNVRVKRALANHRRILRLLSCGCDDDKVLNLLEEELCAYIRFEERTLYTELKAVVPTRKIEGIKYRQTQDSFKLEDWKDRFWLQ